jgi:hydroxymethylpyrimidine kinase/phosphomethylpyrimidine kinase
VAKVQPVTALTIAGSDSGGGAGIQADIRTFSAFEVHGTCAVTAITAQNTLGVFAVMNVDPSLVVEQVRAVTDDFSVAGVKTGMLGRPATVEAVADLAREGRLPHLVVDPVLVSTSGHSLMEEGGPEAYRDALLGFAHVVTPNLREAAMLCGVDVREISDLDDMMRIGTMILGFGSRYVLMKGGHFQEGGATDRRAPDILLGDGKVLVLDAARVATTNDHGTGCSLSAAIAAGLSLGRSAPDATRDAKSFVLAALTGAAPWRLGHGRGPIDHLGWNRE